jgi:hypothetical protein
LTDSANELVSSRWWDTDSLNGRFVRGGVKVDVVFVGGFCLFCFWGRGLATLFFFLYVTKKAGRICVRDMPWPPAAECNMITNKQWTVRSRKVGLRELTRYSAEEAPP